MEANRILGFVFLMFLSYSTCKAQEDCVYDDAFLTDDFLKTSREIEFYKWDSRKKEGEAILSDGAVLSVRKWACNHVGISANMMMTIEQFDTASWKDCVRQLSDIVCDRKEREIIENRLESLSTFESLSRKNCRKEIDISNETYPEFYISIYELNDTVVFSIFNYKIP